MRKPKPISGLLLGLCLISLFACEKSVQQNAGPEEKQAVNYLPGSCPYDCHDVRCKGYQNGYCGVAKKPDELSKEQLIAAVGSMHNAALSYTYYYGNLSASEPNALVNSINSALYNYFYYYQNGYGMTVHPGDNDLALNILNNVSYYNANNGKALDSAVQSQLARIMTRTSSAETALLKRAATIYQFDPAGMTNEQVMNTVISRASAILSAYNAYGWWESGGGDCIGGYLNLVIGSAEFWRYVYLNQLPPPFMPAGGVGGIAANGRTQVNKLPGWIKAFTAPLIPEADALGYLVSWARSYFGGEVSEKKRIMDGLTGAARSSLSVIK